jgi:hypothetical protein
MRGGSISKLGRSTWKETDPMTDPKSVPRILQQQQQPSRDSDPQQQQQGSADFQSKPEAGEVEGEGSYSATRDYQKNIKDYLDHADVKKDAEASKPRSAEEARELQDAEEEGKSHSRAKGER